MNEWQYDDDYDIGKPDEKQIAFKRRTARKAHTCSECFGEILPGSRYEISTWLVDGEITTNKVHLPNCGPADGPSVEEYVEMMRQDEDDYLKEWGI